MQNSYPIEKRVEDLLSRMCLYLRRQANIPIPMWSDYMVLR